MSSHNSSIHDKIRALRKSLKMNQTDFAEKAGVSFRAISQIETKRQNPSKQTLILLAKEFGENFGLDWLKSYAVTTKLDENKKAETTIKRTNKYKESLNEIAGAVRLNLYGAIAAGHPLEPFDAPDEIIVPAQMVGKGKDVETFAVRVRGDSMLEAIRDGDIVIIEQNTDPANGRVVAAEVRGGVTLKRWYRKGRRITLKADNPNYKDINIEAPDDESVDIADVRCIGEFRGLIRFPY